MFFRPFCLPAPVVSSSSGFQLNAKQWVKHEAGRGLGSPHSERLRISLTVGGSCRRFLVRSSLVRRRIADCWPRTWRLVDPRPRWIGTRRTTLEKIRATRPGVKQPSYMHILTTFSRLDLRDE